MGLRPERASAAKIAALHAGSFNNRLASNARPRAGVLGQIQGDEVSVVRGHPTWDRSRPESAPRHDHPSGCHR